MPFAYEHLLCIETPAGHERERQFSMTDDLYSDPVAGKPTPPSGLWPRLHFYGRRNGYVYAA